MASFTELLELNRQGDMGRMLAEKFQGRRGELKSRQDEDLLISFRSESETPFIGQVKQAMTSHYTKLGYTVQVDTRSPPNMLEAQIYHETIGGGVVTVTISTFYPFLHDRCNQLRLTTGIIEN